MALNATVVAAERVVWFATPIAEVVLLVTLTRLRQLSQFRIFAAGLVADIVRSAMLLAIGHSPDSLVYRSVWVISEPFFLVLQTMVALELFRLLYAAYPGIQSFARGLIGVAVLIALFVTFGTVQFDVAHVVWRVPDVQRLFIVKRVVSSLLAVIILLTMACFPRAPSARNVLLHGWLLAVLYLSAAGGFFGINFGVASDSMGLVFMSLQLGCFVAWSAGLREAPPPAPRPSAEQMARIERWNDELLAAAKWLTR